jgi:hypothetical protein
VPRSGERPRVLPVRPLCAAIGQFFPERGARQRAKLLRFSPLGARTGGHGARPPLCQEFRPPPPSEPPLDIGRAGPPRPWDAQPPPTRRHPPRSA